MQSRLVRRPSRRRSSASPPDNKQESQAALDKSRASASPTASQLDKYLNDYLDAVNEAEGYVSHLDKQWVGFPKDVGFNKNLSAPKPDYVEGYRRETFPPTFQELGGAATLVREAPRFPALPHLALELKNAGADMHLAERQAGYDGAAMVYARNKALNFLGQNDEHGNASVLSATTDGMTYNIFAHYTLVDKKK